MTNNTNHEIPIFVGHEGLLDGQRWTIIDSITLGRDSSCEICISDRQISRHHARLTPTENGVSIKDLNSKNGVRVNGKRITEPILLDDGDVVHVALAQKFVYLSSDATLPLEASHPRSLATSLNRLLLEKHSRRVWVNDREILPPLSASQFQLLEIIYKNEGGVVSRTDLMIGVWGKDSAFEISNQALDALTRRLRSRIAEIDPEHSYIATVRGHGLRLDNPRKE
ncbi:MAG: FHA domain-containing protein [Chloroflexota bacterium]